MPEKSQKTKIFTASSGSYPRAGVGSVGHELRKALKKYEAGQLPEEVVEELQNRLAVEVIQEQESAGIDIVTDGLVKWQHCPISHIAGKLRGVSAGEIHHFLDTNFHVRKAVLRELPRWEKPLIAEEIKFAKTATRKPVKAILTGPATLLHYTENPKLFPIEEIIESYTVALAEELKLLAAGNHEYIQIDDPALLFENGRWNLFQDAYMELKKACPDSFLEVKTYGAPSVHLLEKIISLPVDCVGVDCVTDSKTLEIISKNQVFLNSKSLAFGIVNSKNGIIEDPEILAATIEPIIRKAKHHLFIEPSYGLEFIPRSYARAKLETLTLCKKNVMVLLGNTSIIENRLERRT